MGTEERIEVDTKENNFRNYGQIFKSETYGKIERLLLLYAEETAAGMKVKVSLKCFFY